MDFQAARKLAGEKLDQKAVDIAGLNSYALIVRNENGEHRVLMPKKNFICYHALNKTWNVDEQFPLKKNVHLNMGQLNAGEIPVAVVDSFYRLIGRHYTTTEDLGYFNRLQRWMIQKGPLSPVFIKEDINFQREYGVAVDLTKWSNIAAVAAFTQLRETYEMGIAKTFKVIRQQTKATYLQAWLMSSLFTLDAGNALRPKTGSGHTLFECHTVTVEGARKLLNGTFSIEAIDAERLKGCQAFLSFRVNETMDQGKEIGRGTLFGLVRGNERVEFGAYGAKFTAEQVFNIIKGLK